DDDGFQDFLYPAPAELGTFTQWVVAFGGPDPFVTTETIDLGVAPPPFPNYYTFEHQTRIGDLNGDSRPDILMVDASGRLHVVVATPGRANLLERVTDGVGKQFDIEYDAGDGTVASPRTYEVGTECLPSAMCVRNPGPLVSTYA